MVDVGDEFGVTRNDGAVVSSNANIDGAMRGVKALAAWKRFLPGHYVIFA